MSATPEPDIEIRPFATWLIEQSGGKTHEELSEALYDLVARVRDTGKKGSLSLTVNVGPLKGDIDVLVVDDEIKLRLPEHDRKASLFYPDKDGNLTRRDPNQLSFESLREVPEGVNPLTGEIAEVSE
jgi:hypothetical protein